MNTNNANSRLKKLIHVLNVALKWGFTRAGMSAAVDLEDAAILEIRPLSTNTAYTSSYQRQANSRLCWSAPGGSPLQQQRAM
jgi:hypothetical protein